MTGQRDAHRGAGNRNPAKPYPLPRASGGGPGLGVVRVTGGGGLGNSAVCVAASLEKLELEKGYKTETVSLQKLWRNT